MDGPTGRRSKRKREPLRHNLRNDGDPDNCPAKRSKRETRDDLDHGRHCMIVQQAKSVANRNHPPRRRSVARQNLQEPADALSCSRSYPMPFDGRTGRSCKKERCLHIEQRRTSLIATYSCSRRLLVILFHNGAAGYSKLREIPR
jgi:hypothetical protein